MQTTLTPAVLLLDLVPSALAGIDLISFTITPRFRGIKDLPNGWHFVFTGTSNALSVRHGLWFRVVRGTNAPYLAISRWKADSETLIVERDQAEILRWRANIGEFWREGLAPYKQSDNSTVDDWPALTSCISEVLLNRILHGEWILTSASSATQDRDNIPGINESHFDTAGVEEIHLLPIDLKKTWRDGATGRERTDSAMDRSWALGEMIEKYTTSKQTNEIIGELQFCFLMTLTLNNWSCFEQWKRILSLVFTSRTAVSTRPDFFIQFIAAVRLQLQHLKDAEGGLIDMEDESSLLKSLLIRFRAGLQDNKSLEIQDVVDELDDLEAYLRDQFGWEFGGSFARSGVLELDDGEQVAMDTTAYDEDDETGEYAPAVVELSAEQMKILDMDESDVVNTLRTTRLDGLAAKTSAPTSHVQDVEEESDYLNGHDREEKQNHDHADEEEDDDDDDMEEETADLEDLDERY